MEPWKIYFSKGSEYYSQNNYLEAIKAFQTSIQFNENWITLKSLGQAFVKIGNHERAIEVLEKSIALKEDFETYIILGTALHFSYGSGDNRLIREIEAYQKSIDLKESWIGYKHLGIAQINLKDYSKAIDSLKKSIALKSDLDTYIALGQTLMYSNKYPEAIEVFQISLTLGDKWNVLQGLGYAYYQNKNFTQAAKYLSRSAAMEEHWSTYRILGFALLQAGDHSSAIQSFIKSINLNENEETYLGLGKALFHQKSYRKALDALSNGYCISQSKDLENKFLAIYAEASEKGYIDTDLRVFFEKYTHIGNKQKELLLKDYIIKHSKKSKIDTLLLRQATYMMNKNKNKKISYSKSGQTEISIQPDIAITKGDKDLDITGFHRYVFGVSHSELHHTSPNTSVIHCGAGTMFSIGNPHSRTQHFQKISKELERIDPKNSILIFEFGEIDIRKHIFKIAKKKSQSMYHAADTAILNYIEFLKSIKNRGFHILVSGPHCGGGQLASSTISSEERNDLCGYVNDSLSIECRLNSFYFFTLFDKAVNQRSLNEIYELYYDHNHLCLPPSKTGKSLNKLINIRIANALSQEKSQHKYFQLEEVRSKCNLIVSDVPGWKTGMKFEPGKKIDTQGFSFEADKYLILIKLPYLIHPREVILEFKQAIGDIKTVVRSVAEPWDSSHEISANNVTLGIETSDNNYSIRHLFSAFDTSKTMSRYIIVEISSGSNGNNLAMINIKRWIRYCHKERMQKLQGISNH